MITLMKAEELIEKKKDLAKNFHEKRVVIDVKTVMRALKIKEEELKTTTNEF